MVASDDATASTHASFWLRAFLERQSKQPAASAYPEVTQQYPKYIVKLLAGSECLDALSISASLFKAVLCKGA